MRFDIGPERNNKIDEIESRSDVLNNNFLYMDVGKIKIPKRNVINIAAREVFVAVRKIMKIRKINKNILNIRFRSKL
jgi:hypothetical protein